MGSRFTILGHVGHGRYVEIGRAEHLVPALWRTWRASRGTAYGCVRLEWR